MKHFSTSVISAILSSLLCLGICRLTLGQIQSDSNERPQTPQLSSESENNLVNGFFTIRSAVHGRVDSRSGQLDLTVVDAELAAGPISLSVTRTLSPDPATQGEIPGHRWRFGWDIVLHRLDSLALIDEPSGTTVFTQPALNSPYTSATGDVLTIADHSCQRIKTDGTKDRFDDRGRIVAREFRGGHKINFEYDGEGNLTRIEGPYKHYLKLTFDESGRLSRVVCSNGDVLDYNYSGDSEPELSTVKVRQQKAVGYEYDSAHRLAKIVDPITGPVSYFYDRQGRVIRRVYADGLDERWQYDDANQSVTYLNVEGAPTTFRFSSDNRKQWTTDPLGGITLNELDEAGRLVRSKSPSGRTTAYDYDWLNRLVTISMPQAGPVGFTYQSNQASGPQAISAVIEDGQTALKAEYFPDGLPKSYESGSKEKFELIYDDRGRLEKIVDQGGSFSQFEYDESGNLVCVIDPLGNATNREFDSQGRLVAETDALGATTRRTYTSAGLVSRVLDPLGAETSYRYDGRRLFIRDPLGRETRLELTSSGRVKKVTNPAGETTQFDHDALGNVQEITNPAGGVTKQTYDADGNVSHIATSSGGRIKYEYSNSGMLIRETDAANRITTYQYEKHHLLSKTSPDGTQTQYVSTPKGPAVGRIISPDGREIRYQYDDRGNLIRVTEGGREVIRYEYDVFNQCTREVLGSGWDISYQYDAVGKLVQWQDNFDAGEQYNHDAVGRLIEIKRRDGSTDKYEYDQAGNRRISKDGSGNITRYDFNRAGELTRVTAPNGDQAQFQYDLAGRLAGVQRPSGAQMRFAHNGLGRQTELTDPSGSKRLSEYDAAGRLIQTTDGKGQVTRFQYTIDGLLSRKILADGSRVNYQYDQQGRLTSVDDGTFPVVYQYSTAGQLTRVEYPAINRALTYDYDNANGQISKFTDSEGCEFRYQYDRSGRLAKVSYDGKNDGREKSIEYESDARNRIIAMRYPNGLQSNWEFDTLDRPTSIACLDRAGKQVFGWRYRYDRAGYLTGVSGTDTSTKTFQYDASGQIVSEGSSVGAEIRYTYLPGGNRGMISRGNDSVRYQYDDSDRLSAAGDAQFKYDANGNLTERRSPRGITRYRYDVQDRLVNVELPSGENVSYGYAANGNRVWKKNSQGLTYFVSDGTNVLAELDTNLNLLARYIHGPGVDWPLVMQRDGKEYFYHLDRNKNVVRLTDAAGETAAAYQYDAFGNVLVSSGSLANPFLFSARHWDSQTALCYFRARYYDPALGRFLSVDSQPGVMEYPVSLNPYAFAWNNPLAYSDPFGADQPPLSITGGPGLPPQLRAASQVPQSPSPLTTVGVNRAPQQFRGISSQQEGLLRDLPERVSVAGHRQVPTTLGSRRLGDLRVPPASASTLRGSWSVRFREWLGDKQISSEKYYQLASAVGTYATIVQALNDDASLSDVMKSKIEGEVFQRLIIPVLDRAFQTPGLGGFVALAREDVRAIGNIIELAKEGYFSARDARLRTEAYDRWKNWEKTTPKNLDYVQFSSPVDRITNQLNIEVRTFTVERNEILKVRADARPFIDQAEAAAARAEKFLADIKGIKIDDEDYQELQARIRQSAERARQYRQSVESMLAEADSVASKIESDVQADKVLSLYGKAQQSVAAAEQEADAARANQAKLIRVAEATKKANALLNQIRSEVNKAADCERQISGLYHRDIQLTGALQQRAEQMRHRINSIRTAFTLPASMPFRDDAERKKFEQIDAEIQQKFVAVLSQLDGIVALPAIGDMLNEVRAASIRTQRALQLAELEIKYAGITISTEDKIVAQADTEKTLAQLRLSESADVLEKVRLWKSRTMTGDVRVPALVGRPAKDAVQELTQAGLGIDARAADSLPQSEEQQFIVAAQSIAAGTLVKRNTVVTLKIYGEYDPTQAMPNENKIKVPSLIGLTPSDAIKMISGIPKPKGKPGLEHSFIGANESPPSKELENKIAGQSIPAGSMVDPGSMITLNVYPEYKTTETADSKPAVKKTRPFEPGVTYEFRGQLTPQFQKVYRQALDEFPYFAALNIRLSGIRSTPMVLKIRDNSVEISPVTLTATYSGSAVGVPQGSEKWTFKCDRIDSDGSLGGTFKKRETGEASATLVTNENFRWKATLRDDAYELSLEAPKFPQSPGDLNAEHPWVKKWNPRITEILPSWKLKRVQ